MQNQKKEHIDFILNFSLLNISFCCMVVQSNIDIALNGGIGGAIHHLNTLL